MEKEYVLKVNIKEGNTQFIDKLTFDIYDKDTFRCSVVGELLNWSLARDLNSHPNWVKRSSKLIESNYEVVFKADSSSVCLNKTMSEMLFFDDPVIFIDIMEPIAPLPFELNVFLGMLIEYFEDKSCLLILPNWKKLGKDFALLESETISIFNMLGVSIYNSDLSLRFMESKEMIEQKILDSENYSQFD